MFYSCPYGGKCIDPGNPSDCEVNSRCINFKSTQEKIEFDASPDKFVLKLDNDEVRFKTRNQVKFFLTDFPNWRNGEIYVIYDENQMIKVSINEFFN